MGRMIFDILETNIAATIGIAFLCLFAGKLRRRYGAGWMKLAWVLLAVRLLIPYNFSISSTEIRLLNYAGFEQERENDLAEDVGKGWTNPAADAGEDDAVNAGNTGNTVTDADTGQEQQDGNVFADADARQAQQNGNVLIGSGAEHTALGENPAAGTVTDENANPALSAQAGQNSSQITSAVYNTADDNGNTDSSSSMANVQLSDRPTFSYTSLLIKIWIAGVMLNLLYYIFSYILFYGRCKKSLRPITDMRQIKEICRLQKKYIGRAKIIAYKSVAVSSPMITGLIRPKLILPADKKQWKGKELELIMAHELCHYRKKDLWLKMLMVAACCMNWFNPMVYVMKKQFAYEMELACDGSVLAGRNDEEREDYARVMLMFAGGRRNVSVFSTGFGGKRKRMKARIDYMLDTGAKKKGILSIVTAAIFILVIGVTVSCGYKEEEQNGDSGNGGAGNESYAGGSLQGESGQNKDYSEENASEDNHVQGSSLENAEGNKNFNYNHVYNSILRSYQGDLYLAKADGIYYLEGGQGEEQLLYADDNEDYWRRAMEIDGKYLYFSGRSSEDETKVWRMDLETREVVDALAEFDLEYSDYLITNISVYEGNLYVAIGAASERFGFALNENGVAVRRLDQQAEDFLYKEYNEYMRAELEWRNSEYDSEEYWNLAKAQKQRYSAVIDVASCKKLLDGRQVVSKYKDESLRSIYLENEDGTYEHVCDTLGFPVLVTETGLYYPDISGEIWHADFETKQTESFYSRKEREQAEISLITYDADYVYLLQNHNIGVDTENNSVTETYMVRVPRAGGEAQKVYRFEGNVSTYGESGWYRHCGVYDGRMYFDNRESFSLDPDVNNMQAANSGELSDDAEEMMRTMRNFAEAYFRNDEETLHSLLTEDFEGTIEMYAYPEQADQIEEKYLGGRGIPTENIAVGVTAPVYYEFGGHTQSGGATVYLDMELTKTEDGFRVKRYEITW